MIIDIKNVLNEVKTLLQVVNANKAIVFGSFATGTIHAESDIDLVVILNQEGISPNYNNLLRNRMKINSLLRNVREKIPVDLLVYTKDEWELLLASGSSFINDINNNGLRLI